MLFTKKWYKEPWLYFVVFWLALNLVQAAGTELTSDEGYYWFYSRMLEWGYYDHPPMVALMIKTGSRLINGEPGVRIMNVLLSTGTLILLLSLLKKEVRNNINVFLVFLSVPLFNYLGFIVFPDGPLLFFSTLFLLIYKRFIQKPDRYVAVCLGVVIALMLYSKYHALLVLVFTLMANPKLLRSQLFYMAGATAFVLFLPHIWWQYKHQFVTFEYHLSGRREAFSLSHVTDYIFQQLLALGPGLVFIPFRRKTTGVFERTLQYIIIGTLCFFLISSFTTFVHFHWTSIVLVPLLFFAAAYYSQPGNHLTLKLLVVPLTIIVLVARIQLVFPFLPFDHVNADYYHGRKSWAQDIKNLTKGAPVLFPKNLREAGLYSFYSGKTGVAFYGGSDKRSQYDIWDYEDSLQGKTVWFIAPNSFPGSTEFLTRPGIKIFYLSIPDYRSFYNHLPIKTEMAGHVNDSMLGISIVLKNERKDSLYFTPNYSGEYPSFVYSIEQAGRQVKTNTVFVFDHHAPLAPQACFKLDCTVPLAGLHAGHYSLYIAIQYGVLPQAFNSNKLNVVIPEPSLK